MKTGKECRSSFEIEEQVNADNRIKDLLKAGASYAEYVSAADPDNVMSKDRWTS
ncbi:hypothetical protein ACX12E_21285 [Paenibacillus vandeheii]